MEKFNINPSKIARRITRLRASNPRLVWQFLHWNGAPVWKKSIMFLAFAWIINPLDGDFVPIIGWIDDALVTILAWWFTTNCIQDMEEAKRSTSLQSDKQSQDANPTGDQLALENILSKNMVLDLPSVGQRPKLQTLTLRPTPPR